ncbi:MAG TPA: type II secretion system minor pseudopilin GspK [Steroidobacteraceae bacterium]|nr:type II secretion system minor pseudopilin GspK [Steroidobacteraceae bacterium]
MKPLRPMKNKQSGIALITAILIVALATILATNVSFRGYLDQRRTSTQFIMDQGYEVALGAEAWAADTLQKDLKGAKTVDFTQAWATPLPPIPIEGGDVEGGLEDMQGRINLNDLIDPSTGKADPKSVARFQMLLELLEIEPAWAQAIADWIDADTDPEIPDGAEDTVYTSLTPSYRTANMPITRTSELLALNGFGIDRYRKLEPFITALPPSGQGLVVNVCTAPPEVIDAIIGEVNFSQSKDNVVESRKRGCFPSKDVATGPVNDPQRKQEVQRMLTETSKYFRATIFVTIGSTQFTMYSLLYSAGGPMAAYRPILRSFGSA